MTLPDLRSAKVVCAISILISACATSDFSIKREVDAKVRLGGLSGPAAARLYEDGAERYLAKGDEDRAADMFSDAAIYWNDGSNDGKVESSLDRCDSLGMRGSSRTIPCDAAREVIAEVRAKRGARPLSSSTQSRPSYPTTLYQNPPAIAVPSVGAQAKQPTGQENRQSRGFERTYCVQASLLRNDTPSANTLHVKFTNSCPIAVVIGWSARMPNGTLDGGEASRAVPPGGTYNTFLLQKTATGIRHIACSAKSPGFRAVASEQDWYCSPGGE